MLLAAMRDDAYNVVLFIHILSFLVGFAPATLSPLLGRYLERNVGPEAVQTFSEFSATYTKRFVLPALVVLPLTGIGMIMMSDDAIEMSDAWVSAAFAIWLALGGVVSAMILKGEKAVAAGDMSKAKLIETGGKIATVLLLAILYVMVFKPGA